MISAEQAGLAVWPAYTPIARAHLDDLRLMCANGTVDPRTGKHIRNATMCYEPGRLTVVVTWDDGSDSLYEVVE